MRIKKLLTWEFLLPAGVILWIVLWLVIVVAALVRFIAAVFIILGLIDLVIYFFKRDRKEKPKEPTYGRS